MPMAFVWVYRRGPEVWIGLGLDVDPAATKPLACGLPKHPQKGPVRSVHTRIVKYIHSLTPLSLVEDVRRLSPNSLGLLLSNFLRQEKRLGRSLSSIA